MLDRSLCSLVIIVGIEIKNNPTTLTSLTILTTIMIFTSLSPNTEADDIFLALKILISPWLWVKGRAVKELENTLHSFGKIGAMKKLLTLLFFSMSIWFLAARTVLAEECSSNCSGIEECQNKIDECQKLIQISVSSTKPHEEKIDELENNIKAIEANIKSLNLQIEKKKSAYSKK